MTTLTASRRKTERPTDPPGPFLYEGQYRTMDYFEKLLASNRRGGTCLGMRTRQSLALLDAKEGTRLLDIGCNYGGIATLAHEKGFDVTSIDINRTMVELAAAFRTHQGISDEHLRFMHMDLLSNTFEDNAFDSVLFLETIEHVDNPGAYLQAIARVLRPGGHLILSTPNAVNLYAFAKQLYPSLTSLIKRIDHEPMDTGTHLDHVCNWDLFTLYRLLKRNGFSYDEHHLVNLELPGRIAVPWRIPLLSRFARTLLLKVKRD